MLRQRLHAKESRGLGEYHLARATERSKGKGHGLLRPGGDNQSPGIDLLRSGIAHQPCCSRPAVRLRPRRRCITERVEQIGAPAQASQCRRETATGGLERRDIVRQCDRAWRACHRRTYERSEEHTSELQSLMRISYAVFCLKQKLQTHRIYELQKK